MVDQRIRLCAVQDLEDPGARGFQAGSGDWPLELFLVRRGNVVWGYVNRCPHAGHQLNWLPDRFLTRDGSLILCASHGACFELHTGLCVGGPCPGRSLQPVALEFDADDIYVAQSTVAALAPLTSAGTDD